MPDGKPIRAESNFKFYKSKRFSFFQRSENFKIYNYRDIRITKNMVFFFFFG